MSDAGETEGLLAEDAMRQESEYPEPCDSQEDNALAQQTIGTVIDEDQAHTIVVGVADPY